jgi:hypothetical protein
MSLKRFDENGVIINAMKAIPSVEFFIVNGKLYYNSTPQQSGAFSDSTLNIPAGHISLYEYNVDKNNSTNAFSYQFIYKGGTADSYSTVSNSDYYAAYNYGDMITSSYPMSASITREYMINPGQRVAGVDDSVRDYGSPRTFDAAPVYPHFYALKNRLDFYGARSQHYRVSSSHGDKSTQTINLISIPSIFYGTRIEPGTLSLKWYLTGSLIGELQDTKQNGELIEVSGTSTGSVAGVVLYDEGFVLLTGSWDLSTETIALAASAAADNPKWIYFGAGANDGVNTVTAGASYISASFSFSFSGSTETQVVTMFAHAGRGEVNYSNNPTFLKYNQTLVDYSSSQVYEENATREIYNTANSIHSDYEAPFQRQVYISRIVVYDENRNPIGIATLSNPILKEEEQDLTFKLRLDI